MSRTFTTSVYLSKLLLANQISSAMYGNAEMTPLIQILRDYPTHLMAC